MMHTIDSIAVPIACVVSLLAACSTTSAVTCPPPGFSRSELSTLKSQDFHLEDETQRASLALALLDCLGDPDPSMRDGLAFEALATWMRGGQLTSTTVSTIAERLLPRLRSAYPDPLGFERPFAALVLAEVARVDRIEPFLPDAERSALVDGAVGFLASIEDYRGFDDIEGWRHNVAHGADLMLQLSLNPRVGKDDLDRMLSAIATQVTPAGEHFYIYGEPERLARAVYYLASRDLQSLADWQAWFQAVADPAPLPDWSEAFASRAGLAKRHNTLSFLRSLHLLVAEGDSDVADRIGPPMMESLQRVP
jgi:hypothetical protein